MLGGNLVRIDVENARGENLTNGDLVGTKDGSAYGLVFDPQDENVFYFSNNDKHCIYKYDLRTKEWACWAGQEGKSGYLDLTGKHGAVGDSDILARYSKTTGLRISSRLDCDAIVSY